LPKLPPPAEGGVPRPSASKSGSPPTANLLLRSSVTVRNDSVSFSSCTISMYDLGEYEPSSPSAAPAAATAALSFPCTCTNVRPIPSMSSNLTARCPLENALDVRRMMVPISYPSAISPPSTRTPTSNVILGEMMNGPSTTHSSNISEYLPSRLRMRSQLEQVSGSSLGGRR